MTVFINHNFLRERRAEADRTEVLLLASLVLYHEVNLLSDLIYLKLYSNFRAR